jgi:hypothetical protein
LYRGVMMKRIIQKENLLDTYSFNIYGFQSKGD